MKKTIILYLCLVSCSEPVRKQIDKVEARKITCATDSVQIARVNRRVTIGVIPEITDLIEGGRLPENELSRLINQKDVVSLDSGSIHDITRKTYKGYEVTIDTSNYFLPFNFGKYHLFYRPKLKMINGTEYSLSKNSYTCQDIETLYILRSINNIAVGDELKHYYSDQLAAMLKAGKIQHVKTKRKINPYFFGENSLYGYYFNGIGERLYFLSANVCDCG